MGLCQDSGANGAQTPIWSLVSTSQNDPELSPLSQSRASRTVILCFIEQDESLAAIWKSSSLPFVMKKTRKKKFFLLLFSMNLSKRKALLPHINVTMDTYCHWTVRSERKRWSVREAAEGAHVQYGSNSVHQSYQSQSNRTPHHPNHEESWEFVRWDRQSGKQEKWFFKPAIFTKSIISFSS